MNSCWKFNQCNSCCCSILHAKVINEEKLDDSAKINK